jgi:hypothetical protein
MAPDPPEIGSIRTCRKNDREWSVTAKRQIDRSINESPLQINDPFAAVGEKLFVFNEVCKVPASGRTWSVQGL